MIEPELLGRVPRRVRLRRSEQVRAILEANGFIFVRQRGSHMMMQPAEGDPTVPMPKHKEIAQGTLRDIIVQSRLPRSLSENLS